MALIFLTLCVPRAQTWMSSFGARSMDPYLLYLTCPDLPHISVYKMEKNMKQIQYLKYKIQKHLENYPFYTSKHEVKPV